MRFFLQLCCALALLAPAAIAGRCAQATGEPMACPRVWPANGSRAAAERDAGEGGPGRELQYTFDFGQGAGVGFGSASEPVGLRSRVAASEPAGAQAVRAGDAGLADRGGADHAAAGRVHVVLTLRMPAGGTEVIALPSEWAETTGLERGIEHLAASGGGAQLSAGPAASLRVLRAAPGATVRLTYELVGDRGMLAGAGERHRVLLRRGLMEFNGSNGLVAPAMEPEQRVHVTMRFVGLPAGQTVVTSFGTGESEEMTGAWRLMRDGLFVAGALRTQQLVVEGAPVLLAIAGEWRFTDAEAADRVRRILATERMFWRDLSIPWYAVVIEPLATTGAGAAESVGGGGTAFTHAFLLSLAPREGFGAETESLFAHEAFHEWNPLGMGSAGGSATPAWFTEGVTTFYQDRLLERARLLSAEEYLRRVNRIVRDDRVLRAAVERGEVAAVAAGHDVGAGRGAGASAGARLDAEAKTYRAPYLRGALMAMWLDAEIRRQTRGARSLDDLMLALRADREQPLTEDRVLRTAGYLVNAATVSALRGYADGDGEVPFYPGGLAEGLAASSGVGVGAGGDGGGGCVAVRERALWSFDLGMDWGELRHGATLTSVREGSAAWRAGLRNGQTLEGWEMWTGDPDHAVVLMVHGPGGRAEVHYLPRGEQVEVPQAEMVGGCKL